MRIIRRLRQSKSRRTCFYSKQMYLQHRTLPDTPAGFFSWSSLRSEIPRSQELEVEGYDFSINERRKTLRTQDSNALFDFSSRRELA